jgi:hypothetical protein
MGWWGVLNCAVDHILHEFLHSVSDQIQNLTYKIASQPQTKIISKDEVKGLLSLKFLRPWIPCSKELVDMRSDTKTVVFDDIYCNRLVTQLS